MNASKKDETIPSYLVNLNSNLFLYIIDNFYGLKEYKGITSAKAYCDIVETFAGTVNDTSPVQANDANEILGSFELFVKLIYCKFSS